MRSFKLILAAAPMLSTTRFFLLQSLLVLLANAYKPLSESFLRNISFGDVDFSSPNSGLLSPILIPRVPGTDGHTAVQRHFVDFFSTQLPKWTLEWDNSTAPSPTAGGAQVPISNLVFKREPPWTKPGQANWLTLAAHYDSKRIPEGFVGATDGAVPCAIMMHVATTIDRYLTQMHDEMAELGEGGEVEMDMGIQIIFLDGKESWDEKAPPALYGSNALSKTWEAQINPAGSKYKNSLNQISMFVLLDVLGSINPTVPSYLTITHWAYQNMANLEARLRELNLLETTPTIKSAAFLPWSNETTNQPDAASDHVPFMDRGVPFIHLLPSPVPVDRYTMANNEANLDFKTVRDWTRIVTGFTLEWLDMMEVWPE